MLEDKYRAEVKAKAAAETMLDKLKSVTRTELKRLRQDNAQLQETLQKQSSAGYDATSENAQLKETLKVCCGACVVDVAPFLRTVLDSMYVVSLHSSLHTMLILVIYSAHAAGFLLIYHYTMYNFRWFSFN